MNSVVCADGHMEKQEMEMKWKLETKMERQTLSCCSPSKMRVLLAFIPDHPRAIPMHAPPVFDCSLCKSSLLLPTVFLHWQILGQ